MAAVVKPACRKLRRLRVRDMMTSEGR